MAKTDLFVAVAHFANGVKAQIIAAPNDTHAKAELVAACIRSGFEFPCVSVEAFPVDARQLKHLLSRRSVAYSMRPGGSNDTRWRFASLA
jgi:hypothetical protein